MKENDFICIFKSEQPYICITACSRALQVREWVTLLQLVSKL